MRNDKEHGYNAVNGKASSMISYDTLPNYLTLQKIHSAEEQGYQYITPQSIDLEYRPCFTGEYGGTFRFCEDGAVIKKIQLIENGGKKVYRLWLNSITHVGDMDEVHPAFIDLPINDTTDVIAPMGDITVNGTELEFPLNNPDWEVNEAGADGYIANRTHYKELAADTVILNSYSDTLDENGEINLTENNVDFDLIEGKEYYIKVFNREYATTCINDNGNLVIGSEDSSVIVTISMNDGKQIVASARNGIGELPVKLTIKKKGEIIYHKLDKNYLPTYNWEENNPDADSYISGRTHYAETTNSNFLLSYEFDGEWWVPTSIDENTSIPLVEGQEYTIIYNNQEYQFIAAKLQDAIYIGNADIALEEYTVGDFPFIFIYYDSDGENSFAAIDDLQGEEITFNILTETTTYHKLSYDYLPNTITQIPINQFGTNVETAIYSQCINKFGTAAAPATSITIPYLACQTSSGYSNEWIIEFYSGDTATTLILPEYYNSGADYIPIRWVEELTVEANKHYQLSIMDGIALWCAVDMEGVEE